MSRWRTRDDVPLTGADSFLRAFEYETRRRHGASHLSQLVLRLGAGFDAAAFRSLIENVACATPIVRAPIDRPFGIRPPAYRVARARHAALPPVEIHDAPASRPAVVPPLFSSRLNGSAAIERGELVRFDVVRYGGGAEGSDVAMTWAHLLLDGPGSELFVRALDDCFAHRRVVGDLHADDDAPAAPPRALAARVQCAREWQQRLVAFAAAPPRSLAGPIRDVPQSLGYDVDTLSVAETTAVTRRAAAR
jgi:hypothetical protein